MLADQLVTLADRYGNRTFFLGDSLMDPYIGDLSAALVEHRAGILYDGYLRADKLATNRERALHWRRSGLFRVRLGIESASASVLERMKKMTTPQRIATRRRLILAPRPWRTPSSRTWQRRSLPAGARAMRRCACPLGRRAVKA
jgi:radical SAM superfamily enzyme YgiQ (UPF0313 family)